MGKQTLIVDNVGMKFNLGSEKVDSLKDYFIKSLKREIKYDEFWALKDISFTLERGERLGILGLNGAGKSTLLKVIAGVFKPTEGTVTRKGRVVPLLELGKFIDVPLGNYSSGMKSKLGFSIATATNPDILILDEVLSVGDAKFRKKSEKKIMSLMDNGTTVLFVSHSLEQVQRICNKAMILEHGTLVNIGGIEEVSKQYKEMIDK